MTKLRICNRCGCGHFPVTRAFAEAEGRKAGVFFASQPHEVQAQFGLGPLSEGAREWSFSDHVALFERCFHCGNSYLNFHEESEADYVPAGCTLSGIIFDAEETVIETAKEDGQTIAQTPEPC